MTASDFDAYLKIAREHRVAQFKVGDVEVIFAPDVAVIPPDDVTEVPSSPCGHPAFAMMGGMCMECGPEDPAKAKKTRKRDR